MSVLFIHLFDNADYCLEARRKRVSYWNMPSMYNITVQSDCGYDEILNNMEMKLFEWINKTQAN